MILFFYRIYKATSHAGFWNIFREVTSPGITDTDVAWGGTYYYRISAVDTPPVVLESPVSNYIFMCVYHPSVYKIVIETNAGISEVNVRMTATCVLAKPNPYITGCGNLEFFGSGIVPYNTQIKIWTVSAELVRVIEENKGKNIIYWDGKNTEDRQILPGIYIYTYESPKEKGTGKFTVRSR